MASLIGQSVQVADSADRVTGTVGYTLNVELPGMAFGKILRSTVPHARIRSVDTTTARALPGVYCVVTGADVEDSPTISNHYGRVFRDQRVLASEVARFVGEPLAAVAAVSAEVAAEACRLIAVEYEPLPAVFTPEDALLEGAPLLHDPRPPLQPDFRSVVGVLPTASNVASHFKLRRGDVEAGFSAADHVFEDTFRSPAVQHVALEPHVTVASFERGALTLWSSTQMPSSVRSQMAEILGLPISRVRVIAPILGGGFGSKGSLRIEPITTVLAAFSRRPVKVALTREEEFVTVTKHPAIIRMKTGVTDDGHLVARQITTQMNTGAYADVGPIVVRNAGAAGIGPYRIPNVWVDSYAVYTNTVPAGAFRGFGVSQYAWAYESQMDMIAHRLGIDPVELRRRNVVHDGDTYCTGETLADIHYDELLNRTVAAIGWVPRQRRPVDGQDTAPSGPLRRGKSVVAVIKATVTPSTSTASVRLNDDGSMNVLTSSVEMGQGARTVLGQLAAEALELPFDRVHVSEPDTEFTPYDQQTSSSRTTFSMGTAVVRAVEDVRRQLHDLAADVMGARVEDLDIRDGQVAVRGEGPAMSYAQVLRSARRGNLLGSGTFITEGGLDLDTGQGVASVHWHTGTTGVEVEVDVETGRVRVVDVASALFAGRVVNPRLSELQIEGSTSFGLGQALFEEMVFDEGQVANANLADYMIPSFEDFPERITVDFLEHERGGDVHGLAETSLPPVMPAVANAVFDAIGVRITDLPITPEKVLRGLARDNEGVT